ncbi:MAG TPA: TonB-dependent receptor, partial [Thermoanaerobaculia bacterium]
MTCGKRSGCATARTTRTSLRPTALAILLIGAGAAALAQVPHAALEGVVLDPAQAPVAGVIVRLRDPATNRTLSATTDAAGRFRFANVPPSVYELLAEADGFHPFADSDLALPIGRTVRVTIPLSPVTVTESVEVKAQRSALDTSQTSSTTVIDNERIEELPVRSRNFLEFALLAPGVVSTRADSAQSAPSRSTFADSGFSFAGQRPRSNFLTIDGLDNNDAFSGARRTELSLETVKEFEVASGGWSAENGGASGGTINVVTKSGTNVVHGDAFVFFESGRLDARPPLENAGGKKPSLTRWRAGAAVGGPVVADRTFYSAGAERERSRGEAASDIQPEDLRALNEILAGRSDRPLLTAGLFPVGRDETELSAKVTHQASPRDSVTVRFAGTWNEERGDAFGTSGLADRSSRGTDETRDTAGTVSWLAILGSQATNEVRGQVAARRVDLRTTDREGPGVVIPGVAEFGRPYSGNSRHRQRYLELADTAGLAVGPHSLRAGFDLTGVRVTGSTGDGFGGIFVFRSIDAFREGRFDSFRQVFGDGSVDIRSTRFGVFVADRWTSPRVTVDVGLRFDGQRLPDSLDVSSSLLQPRLGVAWTPDPAWVVRLGAGSFADRLPLAAFERALVVDGSRAFERIEDAASLAFPALSSAPSVSAVRRGDWTPSSLQAAVGAEHLLASDLTVATNLVFARGRHLLRTVNVNLLPPEILTLDNAARLGVPDPTPQQIGRPVFGPGRRDPAMADVFEVQPTASSTYSAFTLSVNKRFGAEGEWTAAYTLSRSRDDASDFDE